MERTYYIFRHGETFATRENKGYGVRIFTATILPEGIPALERIGEYLKDKETDYNASSKILRCRQTVSVVGRVSGKNFEFDQRLNEYFVETFGHFQRRLRSFLKFVEDSSFKSVAICTHGAVIGGLVSLLTKGTFERKDVWSFPEPGVLTVITGTSLQEINFRKRGDKNLV